MSFQLPNKEQILYSQLAIIDSLTEYIRDNLENTEFDDLELLSCMDSAKIALRSAHYRMKELIKKTQGTKSV